MVSGHGYISINFQPFAITKIFLTIKVFFGGEFQRLTCMLCGKSLFLLVLKLVVKLFYLLMLACMLHYTVIHYLILYDLIKISCILSHTNLFSQLLFKCNIRNLFIFHDATRFINTSDINISIHCKHLYVCVYAQNYTERLQELQIFQ